VAGGGGGGLVQKFLYGPIAIAFMVSW
jgi:hypothetical protein